MMNTAVLTILLMAGVACADKMMNMGPTTCQAELDKIEAEIAEIVEMTNTHPIGAMKPQCMEDGAYKPRQCMGSMCQCVSADGIKLTEEFSIGEAVNTDCSCARAEHEYSLLHIIGKTFRCTTIGSYAPVQCTGSVCFCTDIKGLQLGQKTVHISFMASLTC